MNQTGLRILDANFNRAREAMRVLEDYARFVLDHTDLCQSLKNLRHDFQTITAPLQQRALLARDTIGDVGTGITTENEAKRESFIDVITAASKRLTEALRTIEEYSKIESPSAASAIEQLRYRAYDLEKILSQTLTPGRERMRRVVLCVLITESLCRRPWLETVELAMHGGADCIQLREKSLDGGELLRRARELVSLCQKYGAICIINDRPDIAVLCGADGVHVGQDDLPVDEARKIIGPDAILGVSTHTIEQAHVAVADGADYVGVGPIFESSTKPQPTLPGLTFAEAAAKELPIPALAISGINAGNVARLRAAGVRSIAVSSAVISETDPAAAARALRTALAGT